MRARDHPERLGPRETALKRIEITLVFTFLYNAVRVFACTSLVLTVVAAGIGRMNPPTPVLRTPRPALRVEPDGRLDHSAWRPRYRLEDPATGRLELFEAPGGQRLNHASCAPWRDSDDRSQMVAQWASFEGRGRGALPSGAGIARYSIPDGKVLDRVPLESPPISPPCWYPGTEARILYTAGDGWLYHYHFDESGDGPVRDDERQPRPLAWPERPAGLERVVFYQATWPNDPRLGGRLIVAMSRLAGGGKSPRFAPSKLWWLQLDPGGTTVEAAGRLTTPRADEEGGIQERDPLVTTTPDGGLVLSYTTSPEGTPGRRPRLAPIEFDPATHAPIALVTASDARAEVGPQVAQRLWHDGRRNSDSPGVRVR